MSASPDPPEKPASLSPMKALLTATQFLLLSPAFIKRPFSVQELGAAVGYYPLVGLLLGGLLLAADLLLALVMPPLVRAALVLGLWVLLTGALHLDGFLDACDGLLGGSSPEQRMQIMRDERVGAYALAGGILLMLVKFSALSALAPGSPALLLAPVLGRWGMAIALVAYPYARPEGLGRDIKDHASWRQALLATAFCLAVVAGTALWKSDWAVGAALAAAGAALWLGARFALKRLPGLTGDIYGALNEIIEAVVLLALVGTGAV